MFGEMRTAMQMVDHSCNYGECSGWSAGCSADPDGGYYTVYSNW